MSPSRRLPRYFLRCLAKRWGVAALAAGLLAMTPVAAAADWYFTPFFGWDLAGNTTLVDLEYLGANRTKVTFGGSVALLRGIVGVEVDYGFVPGFFRNTDPPRDPLNPNPPEGPTIANSHLQILSGSVMLAAPLTLTRESLRPYLVGGVGWMDAVSEDVRLAFPVNCDLTALNVGGGAIGMLGNRAGLRFDLRRFKGIAPTSSKCPAVSTGPRVNFWRATVGVTLRY
jgi:hypothetical protein